MDIDVEFRVLNMRPTPDGALVTYGTRVRGHPWTVAAVIVPYDPSPPDDGEELPLAA